jgi:hypothetical protein
MGSVSGDLKWDLCWMNWCGMGLCPKVGASAPIWHFAGLQVKAGLYSTRKVFRIKVAGRVGISCLQFICMMSHFEKIMLYLSVVWSTDYRIEWLASPHCALTSFQSQNTGVFTFRPQQPQKLGICVIIMNCIRSNIKYCETRTLSARCVIH